MNERPEKVVFYESNYLRCVLEFYQGRVFLHLKVRRWDVRMLRFIRGRFPVLMGVLSELGFSKVEAYFPTANAQTLRMAEKFGFHRTLSNNEWTFVEIENA